MSESRNTINVNGLREYLQIGRTKAYQLAHDPDFYPAFRVGGKILINVEKLQKWIFDQSMKKGEQHE